MGLLDIIPAGVVTGDNLKKLFDYGKFSFLTRRVFYFNAHFKTNKIYYSSRA